MVFGKNIGDIMNICYIFVYGRFASLKFKIISFNLFIHFTIFKDILAKLLIQFLPSNGKHGNSRIFG